MVIAAIKIHNDSDDCLTDTVNEINPGDRRTDVRTAKSPVTDSEVLVIRSRVILIPLGNTKNY